MILSRERASKCVFLYGRSDTIAKYPDLIEKWKKVGLERVFIVLEFFCDDDLKEIRKRSPIENNTKALNIMQSLDIAIFPNLMITPDYYNSDFKEFRRYCLNLDLEFIGLSVMTPLPGTEHCEEVKNDLIIDNYDYYDFFILICQ